MNTQIPSLLNYDEARAAARRRLPHGVFEYIDRGTEGELSLRENRESLDRIRLVPRICVDVTQRDLSVSLFGQPQAMPLVISPTAMAGLVWYDGELELARAAAAHGIPFCVSTQSITPIERIAESKARLWFQLYLWKDRARTWRLVERAHAAGAEALLVTVDTVVVPKRDYNIRNGYGIPIRPTVKGGLDVLMHPGWLIGVLLTYLRREGIPTYAHYPDEFRTEIGRATAGDALSLASDITWDDFRELRRRWPGRLIVKGVLSAEDARLAADCGADGISVSNHGARNLDCAPGPADMLPEILDAVGHRLTVLADSGVRRGSDIAKFMALGAHGVLAGRAPLLGLAGGGPTGARAMLDALRLELETTMAFLGVTRIDQLRELQRKDRPC
jgi:L-lactate dehydrogenase (cytochrome)